MDHVPFSYYYKRYNRHITWGSDGGIWKRIHESSLRWSYESKVIHALPHVHNLLDMGTGTGEGLAALKPLPTHTYATEGYAPCLPLARKRLAPLGVRVIKVGSESDLPFQDGRFDLVINRHASYRPEEVWRVLKPGGLFITQQVGPKNHLELNKYLGDKKAEKEAKIWRIKYALDDMIKVGFKIVEYDEERVATRFYDIGAVMGFLKVIDWQIPGFRVHQHRRDLQRLHRRIEMRGYFEGKAHRFLLIAKKK